MRTSVEDSCEDCGGGEGGNDDGDEDDDGGSDYKVGN